jgi:hypothetical protein
VLPLHPQSLVLLVIAGLLLAIVGVRLGGPIWLLHVGGGIAVLAAVIGYARWDERHRP